MTSIATEGEAGMGMHAEALAILEKTSRTFYIPISRLPGTLQEAVASAYLCLRAIDEVEDHAELDTRTKAMLLRAMSCTLQTSFAADDCAAAVRDYADVLPEVSVRLGDWALLAPEGVAPRVWEATAAMADRMALWAESGWTIGAEADLDRYTFGVAGSVGLLLSDLWAWYNGTQTNRLQAVGFGRGLQAVNIIRNRDDDLARGVDFFPPGWRAEDMFRYARRQLEMADAYTRALPPGPVWEFCMLPLALAYATLDAVQRGDAKLSRAAVLQVMKQVTSS